MEVGCSQDGLTLSSLSSGAAEDEGRGTSPSLAPLLARLGRDERLGWTTSRSRTDDTDSLNVNVSDCGSCHLSEISSVSSWLNDTSVVDDDYSSCALDDETGSEKDDIDEDEDDNGPEIRPLFLLQRCLEEKLLERQQNSDILYPGVCDHSVSTKLSELSSPVSDNADTETNTIKRASRNLCTFKSVENTDNFVPVAEHSVSDTNDVLSAFSQSLPLRRSGSRCNPDSLICTGAIYDFNSSSANDDVKCVNNEAVKGNRSDTLDSGQHSVPYLQQHMHKSHSSSYERGTLPSHPPFLKKASPVKDDEMPLGFPSASKHNLKDKFTVDSKLASRSLEQDESKVGTSFGAQGTPDVNSSACHKQINHIPAAIYNNTTRSGGKSNIDGMPQKTDNGSYQTSLSMDRRHNSPSSIKSKHQETLQSSAENHKLTTLLSVKDKKSDTCAEVSGENIDAGSVVSDEAEKASDPACNLGMPMVEDGLSNSDISDVDEAFSLFAGLKPSDPVPVDTSFGTKSPVTSDSNGKSTQDLNGNTADSHSFSNL